VLTILGSNALASPRFEHHPEVSMNRTFRSGAALLLAGALSACGSSTPSDRAVTITWTANRESGVNAAGGGYRVNVGGQPVIDVPFVSGSAAPTSTVARLPAGTYTVTVVAYAALDAQGGATGSVSGPSQSITVTVP
jgi:hypothetical protein